MRAVLWAALPATCVLSGSRSRQKDLFLSRRHVLALACGIRFGLKRFNAPRRRPSARDSDGINGSHPASQFHLLNPSRLTRHRSRALV